MKTLRTVVADDDDFSVRYLLRLMERRKGVFEVVGIACNGERALTIIENERPDVVFLDIDLPLLNGFEVLEQLVYRPPVVFVTASTEHRERAEQSGAFAYLCKPIGPDDLGTVIDRLEQRAAAEPKNEG